MRYRYTGRTAHEVVEVEPPLVCGHERVPGRVHAGYEKMSDGEDRRRRCWTCRCGVVTWDEVVPSVIEPR